MERRGTPYNGYEWENYVMDWGGIPKKTTPYHPPANGMVERFNQVLKQTILTAYAEKKDLIEEVDKVVAAYRNTPHSVTKVKPSLLMFNRVIVTKLPRFTAASRGKHHREARTKDKSAKEEMTYDRKHRTKTVKIKKGDWAYIRNTAISSTKGQWDPNPYRITHIYKNQITRKRQKEKTRDRSDWKLLKERLAHLQAYRHTTLGRDTAPQKPHQTKCPIHLDQGLPVGIPRTQEEDLPQNGARPIPPQPGDMTVRRPRPSRHRLNPGTEPRGKRKKRVEDGSPSEQELSQVGNELPQNRRGVPGDLQRGTNEPEVPYGHPIHDNDRSLSTAGDVQQPCETGAT